ncbi:MAG: hypothetical protein KJ561_08395 [Nanoarchaeota archaeon]|nr:hypothetical protein [Nanoarchaeota archaeon]
MYKSHSIWDEEKDKDIPITKGGPGIDYSQNAGYNSGGGQSDVYNSQKAKEEEEKKEANGIEREVEKETKKYQRNEQATDESLKVKAASEVNEGTKKEDKDKKDKVHKSIEDAINKAMKAEKEVVYLQK